MILEYVIQIFLYYQTNMHIWLTLRAISRVPSFMLSTIIHEHHIFQDLPFEMLQMLDLPKEEIGGIPLHLHCRELRVPAIGRNKGEILTLVAPVPDFMDSNMKKLQIFWNDLGVKCEHD